MGREAHSFLKSHKNMNYWKYILILGLKYSIMSQLIGKDADAGKG